MNEEEVASHRKHHLAKPDFPGEGHRRVSPPNYLELYSCWKYSTALDPRWWEVGRVDSKSTGSEPRGTFNQAGREGVNTGKASGKDDTWMQKVWGFLSKWPRDDWCQEVMRFRERIWLWNQGLCTHRNTSSLYETWVLLKSYGWLQSCCNFWDAFSPLLTDPQRAKLL